MTDIRKLKDASFRESDLLRRVGVGTVEDLWARVGKGSEEIDLLCSLTGIERARLLELLAAEGMRESGGLGDAWIKRHWLDLALVACAVILILLVVRAIDIQ